MVYMVLEFMTFSCPFYRSTKGNWLFSGRRKEAARPRIPDLLFCQLWIFLDEQLPNKLIRKGQNSHIYTIPFEKGCAIYKFFTLRTNKWKSSCFCTVYEKNEVKNDFSSAITVLFWKYYLLIFEMLKKKCPVKIHERSYEKAHFFIRASKFRQRLECSFYSHLLPSILFLNKYTDLVKLDALKFYLVS